MLTRITCRNKCSGRRQPVGKTGFIVPSIEHPESSYAARNKGLLHVMRVRLITVRQNGDDVLRFPQSDETQ